MKFIQHTLSIFSIVLLPLALSACQSLPQSVTTNNTQSSSQNSNQGYESPIPVHVSGFTGVKF